MSRTQQMLAMLTGAYTKKPGSNLGKLFSLYGSELDRLAQTFERIREWRSIHAAKGAVLDRAGNNYDVPRAGADDATYRLAIQAKMIAAFAGGDPDTLIRSTASLLSVADDEVYLAESDAKATLVVNEANVPNEVFTRLGVVTDMLQRAAAAGIHLVLEMQTPVNQQMYMGMVIQDSEFTIIRQVN